MGAGDRHLKRKQEGSASERPHGKMLKTQQEASEEGFGILAAKKEALAAVRLLRFKRIPGGLDIWMDHWLEMKAKAAAEEAATTEKKKNKVVKRRLPQALIDLMVEKPFGSSNYLTPAQLAKRSVDFRQYYALTAFVSAKLRGYEQALIRQYNAQGYAEDEIEVTDSDSEEKEEELAS